MKNALLPVAIATVLGMSSALADTTTANTPNPTGNAAGTAAFDPTSSSSTSVGQIGGVKLDKIVMSYWGNFAGPRLNFGDPSVNPSSDGTNGVDGTNLTGGHTNVDNILTLGYKITPDWMVSADYEFHTNRNDSKPQYLDYVSNDAFLQVKRSNLFVNNGFSVALDGRLLVPTGMGSRAADTLYGLRTTQYLNWDVPGTKLSLSSYSYIRYYTYRNYEGLIRHLDGRDYAARNTDWFIVIDPYANYQITKSFAATVWFDGIQLAHQVGTSGLTDVDMDIQPGVNWDVNSHLSVNPYINIYPRSLTTNASFVGVYVTAKL